MGERPQGTLAIACGPGGGARLMRLLEPCAPDLYFGEVSRRTPRFNAVCLCPVGTPAGYRRIALAGAPGECLPGTDATGARLPEEPAWAGQPPELHECARPTRASCAWAAAHLGQTMAQLSRLVAEESGLADLAACGIPARHGGHGAV